MERTEQTVSKKVLQEKRLSIKNFFEFARAVNDTRAGYRKSAAEIA
jgi:hypothetical protein